MAPFLWLDAVMLRAIVAVALVALSCCAAKTDAGVGVCVPGTARCTDDANAKQQSVLRCNATGTAWVVEASCPRCVDGSCANPPNPY